MMTYSIIGTGGIGGYYGGLLARSGRDVRFLLHSDYDFVKNNGLRIDSCNGNFKLPHVQAYDRTELMPESDVVLVCLKTTQNHLLKSLLTPLLRPDTVVVLIQNGIGVEADLQAQLPRAQLAGGMAFICSAKVGPGHINHQDLGTINLGNYSCCDEARYEAVVADMRDAGLTVNVVDYQLARWKKAVWNMPFNGMTVALNTTTQALLRHEATRNLVRLQMLEVIGAARALGISGISEQYAEEMLTMTDSMVPYSPSMKLDFDHRRPMEIHYLYSRPIEEAKKIGFEMPRLAMLEAELKFIQSQY